MQALTIQAKSADSALRIAGALKPLTDRETEVLLLVADGLTSGPIAARLCLSVETVKSHVGAIHEKLGAHSRAHAVAIGFRQGLLS